jgi:hypothetical protein
MDLSQDRLLLDLTCLLFRAISEIELFHCAVPKLMVGKRYFILFIIPVFIVQVTKVSRVYLVQYNINECTLKLV